MKIIKDKRLHIILASLFLSMVLIQNASAQFARRAAGIKGGLNVSNLYINDLHDENARLGFNVGVYGQIFASEGFAVQPELLYSTKGSDGKYDDGLIYQSVKFNLNYLDLPVLAVFKVGKAVELHAGTYVSYLLNANISYEGDLASGSDEVDRDNLKSYDYGLVGGIGVNFGNVQVGARYNYGLVKLADSDAAEALIGDSKNSYGQLYMALNLRPRL